MSDVPFQPRTEAPIGSGAPPRASAASKKRLAEVRRVVELAKQSDAHSCEIHGVKIVFRLPSRSNQANTRMKEQEPGLSARAQKSRERSRARKDKFHADIAAGIRVPKSARSTQLPYSSSPPQPAGFAGGGGDEQAALQLPSAKQRKKEEGLKTPTKQGSNGRQLESSPRRKQPQQPTTSTARPDQSSS